MPDSTARQYAAGPRRPGLGGRASIHAPTALAADVASNGGLLRAILRRLRRREKNEAVREAIEELIEETPESDTPISDDQRVLLANILKLRDKTVARRHGAAGRHRRPSPPTRRSTRSCA